jgi:hypothetical protein
MDYQDSFRKNRIVEINEFRISLILELIFFNKIFDAIPNLTHGQAVTFGEPAGPEKFADVTGHDAELGHDLN